MIGLILVLIFLGFVFWAGYEDPERASREAHKVDAEIKGRASLDP